MRGLLILGISLAGLVSAPLAQGNFARENVWVFQVSDVVFETVPNGFARTDAIWCAASEYALQRLGAAYQTQIYVVRGRGKSVATNRNSAYQFTLAPEAAGITPVDLSFRSGFVVGDHMSIQLANTRCGNFSLTSDVLGG